MDWLIGTYDIVMVAIVVFGAVIGYLYGILKMLRPVISLIISRYLFAYVGARLTGMNVIRDAVRKMVMTGTSSLISSGNVPSDKILKLTGSGPVITAEEMFAGYVASLAVFAISYVVVWLVIGLFFKAAFTPRNRMLYFLDKIVGLGAGAAISVALLLVAFMVILSMAYVGSPWAAGMLQEVNGTIIFSYVSQFI